jgi:hypothetical protein
MMESLTLSKAMELYEILGPHIPEVDEDEDPLEFIGKIITHINSSNQHEDYTLSVELMSEKSWEEIKKFTSSEVLELFIDGLIANKIIQLKSFCDTVGFSHA